VALLTCYSVLCFRNVHVEKTAGLTVTDKSGSKPYSEMAVRRIEQAPPLDATEVEQGEPVETSFKRLWSDYSADWKDTRRYHHTEGSAASRKLCKYGTWDDVAGKVLQ